MAKKNFTDKRKRFVEEYLVDSNATAAAKRAGYSPRTAHEIGRQLLLDPVVAAAVAVKQETVAERLGITAERVLRERARLAFYDPRNLRDKEGRLLQLHELDEDTARAVVEYDDTGLGRKIKLASKDRSLSALERHLGLYADDGGGDTGGLNIHIHL